MLLTEVCIKILHWIGISIYLSPDNFDTILYNITTMADHDLVFWRCRNKEPHSVVFWRCRNKEPHSVVFWRCRNKEPHSSGFLCRVVLSGTKTFFSFTQGRRFLIFQWCFTLKNMKTNFNAHHVSLETKFASEDSNVDNLSEKLYLNKI